MPNDCILAGSDIGALRRRRPCAGHPFRPGDRGKAAGRRSQRRALLAQFFCLAMLSACQSGGSQASLDADGGSGGTATKPRAASVLGTGPAKVTMLLPLSAKGAEGEKGRRMRDAAELAVSDLGSELITLTIADTAGNTDRARKLASEAISSGSRVVIGPTDPLVVRHVASITGRRPPVLALAEGYAGAPGVYPVLLTEADSAGAAAAWLAGKGKRKFVLFVAEGPDAKAIERRVENGLSIHGAKLSATLPYTPSGIDKAISDMQALVEGPEAVVLASGGGDPELFASALRSTGYLGKETALVVTHRALEVNAAAPSLEGAYVATLGKPETDPFADRFGEKYSYAPDLTAAYAYDTVALSSGLVSALGPEGIKRQTLESKSGFRGSTGFFRFREDGTSERTMPLYRIGKSGLAQVQASVSSF